MIERFIAPALTFTVLIAGHVAIVSAMFGSPATRPAEAQMTKTPVIQLEAVVITGKRAS
ncbi:MAG: hypothetical protein H7Y33_05440 [Cytophagales bacterium]|nr:hypothetical protein [Rhizobacter sp.]